MKNTGLNLLALSALVFSITSSVKADLMSISFDDGGNNVGSGVLDVENGYAVSGDFVVTAGLASGEWTLMGGTPSSAGAGSSPNGYFNYDNMVSPGSDPYLTTNGGLLFTNNLGDELNIWANGPDTYCMWAADTSGNYYVEAGFYAGFSNATGYGTSTITNAPPSEVTSLSPPLLSIQSTANGVTLAWPASGAAFRVLQNSDLTTTDWVANTNTVTVVNGTNQVTIPVTSGNLFFRLVNP